MLSVVVPVYNVRPWLNECLASLTAQSHTDLEIIVINDGSTDGSDAIARRHARADPRITVHDFPNGGLGLARNRGLQLCSGRYVLFTDSDDRVPSGAVQAMMDSLLESTSDVVTGRAIDFYTDPDKLADYWTTVSSAFRRSRQAVTLADVPELIHDHTVWNKIYSLDFLRSNDISFPERTLCEDVHFSAQVYTQATSIDIVSDYVYEHRRRRGAISNALGNEKSVADWTTETRKVVHLLQDQPRQVRDVFAARSLQVEAYDRARWVDASTSAQVKAELGGLVSEILALGSAEVVEAVPDRYLAVMRSLQLEITSAAKPRAADPKLSIVVPVLNVDRWIDDCLLSIRRQDFADLEIVVVDDGSVDRTVDAIAEHLQADPRIHYLRSYGTGGGTARNIGVDWARGEYLAFADGDDMVPQGAYTRFVSQLDASKSDMVVGDYVQLGHGGLWHPHWKNRRFAHQRERITIGEFPELVLNRCCWDKMFRRSFWDRIGNFFPDARRANDIAPMVRAYVNADTLDVLPGYSYIYRKRPGNSSMTSKVSRPESLKNYLEQERICAEMVLRHGNDGVTGRYFSTLLEKDLWVHLTGFLSEKAVRNHSAAREVFDAAAALLHVVPAGILDSLEPRRRLVYELILSGTTKPLANLRQQALSLENGGIGSLFAWKDALVVCADERVPLTLRRQAYSRGVLNRLVHEWPAMPGDQRRLARARVIRFAGAHLGHLGRLELSRADRLRFVLIAVGSTTALGALKSFSGKGHPKRRMWRFMYRQPAPVQRIARSSYQKIQRHLRTVTK